MKDHLINIEKQAFALRNAGEWMQASILFEQLVKEEPRWEHGYGFLSLAQCYEELGRYEDARAAYKKALHPNPSDCIILGSYASFLYLHGDPVEAIDTHLKLLRAEHTEGGATESIKIALRALAGRVGMSKSLIEERIALAESSMGPSQA